LDELPAGLVAEVEAAVRAERALALRKLTRVRLSRRAEGLLYEGLARRGLERTGKTVRVPLREQVTAVLARGDAVPVTGLRKLLRGVASAAELKLVVSDLVRTRRAVLVVRGGKEHVAAPSAALVSGAELGAVQALAKVLGKLATATRARAGRPARALWRAELVGLLDDAREALGGATADAFEDAAAVRGAAADALEDASAVRLDAAADPVEMVVAAVRAHAGGASGLASVPQVAQALGDRMAGEAFRQALLGAAAAGLLELRPESGVGLLPLADAALCPRGPDGSPLSYARLLGGGAR
jgi:hypothetical protein